MASLKKESKKPATQKAYLIKENGTKHWFDMPVETAAKVLRLQKMFSAERAQEQESKPLNKPKS